MIRLIARLRDARGMSMIEIVIAMLLLAILVLAMAPVFMGALQLARTNATVARATQIVNAQLELARDQAAFNPQCSAIQLLSIVGSAPVTDPDAEPLAYTRTVGACPSSYPGTVKVTASVTRTATGALVASASTLVVVVGP